MVFFFLFSPLFYHFGRFGLQVSFVVRVVLFPIFPRFVAYTEV